jgi:transposase InsO family protein
MALRSCSDVLTRDQMDFLVGTAIGHTVPWPWLLPRRCVCQVNGMARASYVAIDLVGRFTSTLSRPERCLCTLQARRRLSFWTIRDSLFTSAFSETLASAGVETIRLPARSTNLNAYAERFVRSVKESCLDRLILVGEGRSGDQSVSSSSTITSSATTRAWTTA